MSTEMDRRRAMEEQKWHDKAAVLIAQIEREKYQQQMQGELVGDIFAEGQRVTASGPGKWASMMFPALLMLIFGAWAAWGLISAT